MKKTPIPVAFTIYTSASEPLSKIFTLEKNKVAKTPSALMYMGNAARVTMLFKSFGEALSKATSQQAFGYGLPMKKYPDEVDIVVSGKEQPKKHILSRTKKYFAYRKQPGILMLDHDPSEYGSTLTADKLIDLLISIDPGIATAARIIRGSVSAGVHLAGKKPKSSKGFHIYIPVIDASAIPSYGKLLFDHLWLKGYGYIALAANGAFLVRTPIDDTVFSGERIDFVGQPIIQSNGIQYTEPMAEYVRGTYLDASKLPVLTDKEARKVKTLIARAKKAIKPDSVQKANEYKNNKIDKTVRSTGISRDQATALVTKVFAGKCKKLWGDWVLEFPDGDVTVAEVLKNHDPYDNRALSDPIEGREYGKTTAKFWWNDGKSTIHSFAHGEDSVYFLSETRPKRYIEGVEPYFDSPDYLPKEDACKQMQQAFKQWINNPIGHFAIAAPAGIGKTTIILKLVALVAPQKFIEIYVPTHQLANEVRGTLLKFNPALNVVIIRGRSYVDEHVGTPAPCKKSALIKSIQDYDYNILRDVCNECEFNAPGQCEYLDQFDNDTNVRVFTHKSLAIARGNLDRKLPDMVIIDERFFTDMIDIKTITLRRIANLVKNKSLAEVIVDALNDKDPLLSQLRKTFGKNVVDVIEEAIVEVRPKLPKVTSETEAAEIKQKLDVKLKNRRILALMLEQLKAEIEKFPRRKHSITVRRVKDEVVIANRHQLSRFSRGVGEDKDEFVPVLCIDADFCPSVAKVFLPGIKSIKLSVERKAHITQIYSTTNAKTRSIPREHAEDGDAESEAAKKHIKDIQGIIDNVYADYGPALIVSYQALVGNQKNKIKSKLVLPPGCNCVHFGALRGLNQFQHLDTAIIIGRNQLPIDAIESQAAAIWWDSKKKLLLTGERRYEERGYRLKNPAKKIGVPVMVCEDYRAQYVQHLQRECESLQAIDRLRLIHNKSIKNVFVLSNVPLDITVDNLLNLKKLIHWKSKIEKALVSAPHGVLPLSSKYLHHEYPQLFANESMAKNEVSAAGLGETIEYFLHSKKIIEFNRKQYNLISFRVKGDRGGDRKALVPKKMLYGVVSRRLKDIFQAKIEIIETTIRHGGWGGNRNL